MRPPIRAQAALRLQAAQELSCGRLPRQGVAGLHAPAIIFRGPGFHITDYGRGNGNGKKGSDSKTGEPAEKVSSSADAPKPSGGKD